jgi:FixJ family two-component response regulator
MQQPPHADGVVYVVQQDSAVCDMLRRLLVKAGLTVCALDDHSQFRGAWMPQRSGCLIVPPQDGDDGVALLLRQLALRRHALPVIYLGPCSDVQTAVRAMKAGALDFLVMPARPEEIVAAVGEALAEDQQRRLHAAAQMRVGERYATLSRRERQVFSLVVTGLMNKHMADQLCLSESSIKIHRSNVMKKMGARTLVDLVHMNQLIGMGSQKHTNG